MRIDSHLRKWQRFHSLRARFEPSCEFELWYWATLSGGTSLINAALHQAGITAENALFATQIPDVYAVHDGPGLWHHELGIRCDLIHVGLPAIDAPLPADIDRAFQAMMTIELYRDPCVRSGQPITAEVVGNCEASYAALVSAIEARLQLPVFIASAQRRGGDESAVAMNSCKPPR